MTRAVNSKNSEIENFIYISNAYMDIKYDIAINDVSKCNSRDFKELANDILEAGKLETAATKNRFVNVVNEWKNSQLLIWQEDLIDFCKEKSDICKALSITKECKQEFIIVMEDSTADSVLDYNEFGFELKKKYKCIHDFMILDLNTSKNISNMFNNIEILYERRK